MKCGTKVKLYSAVPKKKIISSKTTRRIEIFITLASTKAMFFIAELLMHFRFYGNLKFPLTYMYNGKSENVLLLSLQIF